MPRNISTEAVINSIRLAEQASAPTGTVAGYLSLYGATDGIRYVLSGGSAQLLMRNPLTTLGDIVYLSSGSAPARLAIGSSNQVLTVSAGIPAWAAAGSVGYTQGARVYNDSNISINNNELTWLTFNTERYDTDTMHVTGTNSGRLTATTGGKYLIMANLQFAPNVTGIRRAFFRVDGTTIVSEYSKDATISAGYDTWLTPMTIWDMSAGAYMEVGVLQVSGGVLDIVYTTGGRSPEFMMQRIG